MYGMISMLYFSGFFMIFTHYAYSAIWPTHKSSSKLRCYSEAAVSVDSPPCGPIGEDILERNGSAVDAAIAMLVCLGVSQPQSSGLGGGFLMVYYNRSKEESYFIDAREVAPRNANETHKNGPKSIAVPGELAGYEVAHKKYGQLPWKDLFTPSIKLCEEGISISKHLEMALESPAASDKIKNLFKENGTISIKEGEMFKCPKIAQTLKEISKIGKKALYGNSTMAEKFLKDLKNIGSIIDSKDMEKYSPRIGKPIKMKLKNNFMLHTSALPGYGVILSMMLGILDGYTDLNKKALKNDTLAATFMHRFIEISKYADKYRSFLEDSDSNEMKKLVGKFTSKAFVDKLRNEIDDNAASNISRSDEVKTFLSYSKERDSCTTHLSVLAPNGDAVAVTSTINTFFGSGNVSSSTGIILNNQMADFSCNSSKKSINCVKPGKRPISTMSPSIFTDSKGDVKLIIGASGGRRIASTIMQVVARILYFDENIKESIDAPRFHADIDVVEFEKSFPKEMKEKLRDLGHKNQTVVEVFTVAQGILRTNSTHICANADYRKDGVAGGLD